MHESRALPFLWWLKCFFVVVAIIFGVFYTLPSFITSSSFLPSSKINLGLDLKGGLSLTLNVEVEKAVFDAIGRSLTRAKEDALADNIQTGPFEIADDFSVKFPIKDASQISALQKKVLAQTNLLLYDEAKCYTLYFKPHSTLLSEYQEQVMRQAIHTIRSRIDQFGVAEPNVFQAGQTRIVVELPGLTDIERAKQLLGNTAALDFRLVRNEISSDDLQMLLAQARLALKISPQDTDARTVEELSRWLRDNQKIPAGRTIILNRTYGTGSASGVVVAAIPYLVDEHARLSGDMIEDAQPGQTTENFIPQYMVSLTFKPQGAQIFAELTTEAVKPENTPHKIAIILDGNIYSDPVVNGPILGGNASITMGRRANSEVQFKEAQDLALVLRAGALPARVSVVEERQVGPSEGAQNIRSGVISTLIAAGLVVVLMTVVYGLSGVIANVAMLLNVLLILAFMALFGATLTLPGIAGIVLTMAIAVDGNVVINERIREELRAGHSARQAFYQGYRTSFRTLIDAHMTSAVAGIVLLIYGNPTVRGFAVTLLCGIICTLFTSYYVTEVIGQWLVEKMNWKRFA